MNELTISSGHVVIWPGRAIYLGPLLDNEAHAHHAIQISIALDGTLSLQAARQGRWAEYRAVATAPDQLHRIRCQNLIAQIYLDPESGAGLALRQQLGAAGLTSLDADRVGAAAAALRDWLRSDRDATTLAGIVDAVTRDPGRAARTPAIDPRVEQALALVNAAPGRHCSLQALADRIALSPSRLGSLFSRETGIPLRRYLLWLRLIDAIEALAVDSNLTEAAYDAGFADSAHFTRTFRRMFGMPPSALLPTRVEVYRSA